MRSEHLPIKQLIKLIQKCFIDEENEKQPNIRLLKIDLLEADEFNHCVRPPSHTKLLHDIRDMISNRLL